MQHIASSLKNSHINQNVDYSVYYDPNIETFQTEIIKSEKTSNNSQNIKPAFSVIPEEN